MFFIDTESQVAKILANSEYYGITTDKDLASRLLIDVRNSQDILQKKAYKLCGYHFNFNSSKDVAKVLDINNLFLALIIICDFLVAVKFHSCLCS